MLAEDYYIALLQPAYNACILFEYSFGLSTIVLINAAKESLSANYCCPGKIFSLG